MMSEKIRFINKNLVYFSLFMLVMAFNVNPINDYSNYETFDLNDWSDLDECNQLAGNEKGPGDIYCMKYSQIFVSDSCFLLTINAHIYKLYRKNSNRFYFPHCRTCDQ